MFNEHDLAIEDIISLKGSLVKTLPDQVNYIDWWYIVGNDKYEITIEQRPGYCNRGRYLAKAHVQPSHRLSGQDIWPRYYFSLKNCLWECNEWLKRRRDETKKQDKDPYEDY